LQIDGIGQHCSADRQESDDQEEKSRVNLPAHFSSPAPNVPAITLRVTIREDFQKKMSG
jgi:hypothetical protein